MTASPETVGIVGAGAFGTALGHVVAARGGDVLLWGDAETAGEINSQRRNEQRLPGVSLSPRLAATDDLAELARAARLVILAMPSRRVLETVRALGTVLDGRHLLVHSSGALFDLPGAAVASPPPRAEPDGGPPRDVRAASGARRLSDIIREETSVKRVGVLAGPALARDLAERRACALVVASAFDEVLRATRAALGAPPVLRVYSSRDLAGVELASAISGALTVVLGLADGLGIGAGPRAVLVTRAMTEAARLGLAAGARERTFHGLAGLGNLLVRSTSGSSDRSDDYQLGLAVGRGEPRAARATEGTRAATAAVRLAQRLGVRVPILEAVHAVAHEGVAVDVAAARLTESPADEE